MVNFSIKAIVGWWFVCRTKKEEKVKQQIAHLQTLDQKQQIENEIQQLWDQKSGRRRKQEATYNLQMAKLILNPQKTFAAGESTKLDLKTATWLYQQADMMHQQKQLQYELLWQLLHIASAKPVKKE